MSLLEALVLVSEKAANLARICRQDEHLFKLLVQEKSDRDANPRFVQDFKTLADVLIQEIIIHDIGSKFPELKDNIRGEENNTFENTLGESITVQVKADESETAKLLEVVLNGDSMAANLLAKEVHREIEISQVDTTAISNVNVDIDLSKVGIWIDPIDSTAEYISGTERQNDTGIHLAGLRCVTVLIGGFSLISGKTIVGVVNQPFNEIIDEKWRGTCYWGISASSSQTSSLPNLEPPTIHANTVCLSSSEDTAVKTKLSSAGFTVIEAAGAGYKILTTITGQCDAYVLSKGSTYAWDTCGPQAVLRALGGDIVAFRRNKEEAGEMGLVYSLDGADEMVGSKKYCNMDGVIAYRDERVLERIRKVLGIE